MGLKMIFKKQVFLIFIIFLLSLLCSNAWGEDLSHKGQILKEGKLLVAGDSLKGPYFGKSLVLIVKYDKDMGAFGLVINKETNIDSAKALIPEDGLEFVGNKIFAGGPVFINRPYFLFYTYSPPDVAEKVLENVYFSAHLDFKSLKTSFNHYKVRVYSGIANWGKGQLEAEIKRGDWSISDIKADIVFSDEFENLWADLKDR